MLRRFTFILVLVAFAAKPQAAEKVVVGSKAFTESVILGEIARELAQTAGASATHQRQLGGTRVLWNALVRGEIDLYPEYTGTIAQEIFAGKKLEDDAAMRAALAMSGIEMSAALGFNNTYAIGMLGERAEKFGIVTITDLKKHPELRLGFSNEFMDRGDGWPALKKRYELPQANVTGLDHDLAYRALKSLSIEATDLYSTDAEIQYYHLRVLRDDLHHFPEYKAVYLYRKDLATRAPKVVEAIKRMEGAIDEPTMIAMNARAKLDRVPEAQVAADFLEKSLGVRAEVEASSMWQRIARRTLEHLFLVGVSLLAAISVAIPLGIWAARSHSAGQIIIGVVAMIYTIPSLALLVFMIPLLGIGAKPAITALFLYSLLPIVRNTHAGLVGIPLPLRESAAVLGLSRWTRLMRIELPLASPSILAGIKTSAVICVGTATLGALIGAGGYGQPILTGIRLDNTKTILEGAVPAAVLALLVQGVFELIELIFVPRGLRLKSEAA
ncbi:MAG TPA: glycine betaine ABC transporter substrate-binding protein [Tepidisphaeraceae bacterium]|jgi:osmoprotectant transport system permease protein|nr:glycine betaine ABC transporter substrate-binding protein [Tepidisphaeraceae bacterium]